MSCLSNGKALATPFIDVETFRGQMGVLEGEYKTMSNFKARVLDLAVKEINEKQTWMLLTFNKRRGGWWLLSSSPLGRKNPLKIFQSLPKML